MSTLPNITKLQVSLIKLLFDFRYIKNSQVKNFLGHKSIRQTNRHLKTLKDKGYIRKVSIDEPIGVLNVGAYCLGPAGVRLMREIKGLTHNEVKNRYKDQKRSLSLIDHQLLLIEIFLQLKDNAVQEDYKLVFQTEEDFEQGSVFNMLHPDAYAIKQTRERNLQYFFEIVDLGTPDHIVKKRVRSYVKYFLNNSVEVETGEPYPTVLFILPHERLKSSLLYYADGVMREAGAEDLVLKATTKKQVLAYQVIADIWERVGAIKT